MTTFVEVEVEPDEDDGDLISLRWKATEGPFPVRTIELSGVSYRVFARADDGARTEADGAIVEDSSDGVALLVRGGPRGVVLVDATSGAEQREPYLLLARTTAWT